MLLLMVIGLVCSRVGFLHQQTITDLTSILLYVVSPCLILNAFQQDYSPERMVLLGKLFVVMGIIFAMNIALAALLFSRKTVPDPEKRVILKFGSAYTNAGFIGVPLAQAVGGQMGVFCAVPYLVLYNVFLWTHGITLFRQAGKNAGQAGTSNRTDHRETLRKILLNPNILAAAAGILLYAGRIHFPSIIGQTISHVASLNTALSMIVIGSNLAAVDRKTIFTDRNVWIGAIIRNIVFPLLAVGILSIFRLGGTAASTTLIEASCPVAGVAVLFSVLNGYETEFPTKLMCLSTILSVVTVPLMILNGESVI